MGNSELSSKSLTPVSDLHITFADGSVRVDRRFTRIDTLVDALRSLPSDATFRIATFYEEV